MSWDAPCHSGCKLRMVLPNPETLRRGPAAPAEPPVSSTMKMRFRFLSPGLISFTKVSVVMLPEPQHPTRRGKADEGSTHGPSRVHFARPIYHTRLVRSPKPYNSSKRVETDFPVALQLQDQNLRGLWIGCFGAGSPPSPEAFSLKSRSGEADGNRGREPDAEPRDGISLATPSRTLIWTIRDSVHPLPQPTAHHPPSQPARRTVHAAESPAGGAKGPQAAGCGPMERRSQNIPGSFPRPASSSQSALPRLAPCVPPGPHPANRDSRFTRSERGGMLGIKGASERVD